MGQIEALQKELAELREENKRLYEWKGFAKASLEDLISLAQRSGKENHSNVKTALRFLADEGEQAIT